MIRFAIGVIILLMVGMILGPSSVASATSLIDTTTNAGTNLYENPKYGIQLRYPQDWLYFEDANIFTRLFAVVFMSPAEALQANGQAGEVPVGLAVLITNIREPGVAAALGSEKNVSGYNFAAADIQTVGQSFLKSIMSLNSLQKNNNTNIQIISTNSSAVLSDDDMPAYEMVVVDPNKGTKWLYTVTLKDDWLYVLVYGGSQSRYEKLLPTAKDMIRSFTIAK
ncbi:MAG: PsbP-related protein [Nitrososphaera sp.]